MHEGSFQIVTYLLEMWRQFFRENTKKLVDLAHKYGAFYQQHSCGAIRPLIPELISFDLSSNPSYGSFILLSNNIRCYYKPGKQNDQEYIFHTIPYLSFSDYNTEITGHRIKNCGA